MTSTVLLYSLSSCKKIMGNHGGDAGDHARACHVVAIHNVHQYDSLSLANYPAYPDTWAAFRFYYNSKGDPVRIIDTLPLTNQPNQYFRYDSVGRLSDFIRAYSGNNVAYEWHKYEYPRPNYVVDTFFNLTGQSVLVSDPAPVYGPDNGQIAEDSLDSKGRIIMTFAILSPGLPRFPGVTYSYDANGNKVRPANPDYSITYDNKVNVYRTNKVFQFVYNDFSRNNPIPVGAPGLLAEYNIVGLPTKLPMVNVPGIMGAINLMHIFTLPDADPTMDIEYACSMPKGPVDYPIPGDLP